MTGDDGKELEPLYGSGLTGLRNLGNRLRPSCPLSSLPCALTPLRALSLLSSCYLASTVQSLFALPAFQRAYFDADRSHTATCALAPDACFTCQLRKVADGLLSGRYAHPSKRSKEAWQDGLKPSMLKELVGKGHEEFASMRQQGPSRGVSASRSLTARSD